MSTTVLLPEALVGLVGVVGLVGYGLRPALAARWLPSFCVGAVLVALLLELIVGAQNGSLFKVGHGSGFSQDRFALFAKLAVLVAGAVALVGADWEFESPRAAPLALLALLGAMVAASAADLPSLWVGVELAAFASVAVVGLRVREEGVKLLLAGGLAAALVAFGFALLYGISGFSTLVDLRRVMGFEPVSLPLGIAIVLVMLGLTIRLFIGAFRTLPAGGRRGSDDSPLGSALLGALSAGAAAIVLLKVLAAVAPAAAAWSGYLLAAAVAAMLFGAIGALAASDRRRGGPLIASLTLVQVGWIAAGAAAHSRLAIAASLFLLGAYMVAAAAGPIFAGYPGPAARAAHGIVLLSLAGAPPLAGWFGQVTVAIELARAGLFWLLAIGLLASVLSGLALVRALRLLYFEPAPDDARAHGPVGLGRWTTPAPAGAIVAAGVLVAYGLFANPLHGLAVQGATALGLR